VLFANREVADLIADQFEPVWVSVRPAPQVTIDFGNGHVLRRTLQGNIASYVCLADGTVVDVLPGIYPPALYARRLEVLALMLYHILVLTTTAVCG
jgi:hypothetical protein